jgi:drug/metabolite transporter (DMT)-like permease
MHPTDLARLILLSAIWGASFLFMRILATALGPFWIAESRSGIAALALLPYLWLIGQRLDWRKNGWPYLVIGLINSAVPFALFGFAAHTLPAGYSAIINATSPIWGALLGSLLLGDTLRARQWLGMVLGIGGVALLVKLGPMAVTAQFILAVLACLAAAFCYGLAATVSKRLSGNITPQQTATGSMVAASIMLLPTLPLSPIVGPLGDVLTGAMVLIMLALGLLCSAFAYLLYFRLVANIGPGKTLTVTFLVPLFALLWGVLFLHEHVGLSTLAGCGGVVLATWLVTGAKR